MNLTGELTAGAIGIMLTIALSSLSGIVTLVAVYIKTRTDITALQLAQADMKSDMIELKSDIKSIASDIRENRETLTKVAAKQEAIGTIVNLPQDMASALAKLLNRDR